MSKKTEKTDIYDNWKTLIDGKGEMKPDTEMEKDDQYLNPF